MKTLLFLVPFSLAQAADLTVYVYDSFVGKGTLGEKMKKALQEKFHMEVEYVVFPNAGEAINQLALEKKKPKADIIVGVDELLMTRVEELDVLEPWPNSLKEGLEAEIQTSSFFLPFDYGYITLLRREPSGLPPGPISLLELARRLPPKSVATEDPRKSSIGLAFLASTHILLGDKAPTFWTMFSPKILTTAPGWSAAYGLFLKGDASYVVTVTTSLAYHKENKENFPFEATLFSEGNYRQTENLGLLKSSPHKEAAIAWAKLLVSPEIQAALPQTQWMYPARKNTALPESFKSIPVPKNAKSADPKTSGKNRASWISQWERTLSGT